MSWSYQVGWSTFLDVNSFAHVELAGSGNQPNTRAEKREKILVGEKTTTMQLLVLNEDNATTIGGENISRNY